MVILHLNAVRSQQYPAGQLIEVGYKSGDTTVSLEKFYLLDDATITLRVPSDGSYQFFITNYSFNAIYMTSLSLDTFHYSNH